MLYPTKTFVQSYIQRKHEQVCWYLKARNSFSGKDQFKQEVKRGHEWDGCQCQVLCNAVLALGLGFLYLLDLGSADLPVVFRWVSDIQTFCSAAVSPSAGTTTAVAAWAWRCWGRSPAAIATPLWCLRGIPHHRLVQLHFDIEIQDSGRGRCGGEIRAERQDPHQVVRHGQQETQARG